MLVRIDRLMGYDIVTENERLGSLQSILIDDDVWKVRYLVLSTGEWLPDRKVVFSPQAFQEVHHEQKRLYTLLTRTSVEESPCVPRDRPLSLELQTALDRHYGWSGASIVGTRLHCAREMAGYLIEAQNGPVGRVKDFMVDDITWGVRYILVAAGPWLQGKKILVAPGWIQSLKWDENTIRLNLLREEIASSPEYTPGQTTSSNSERLRKTPGVAGYGERGGRPGSGSLA